MENEENKKELTPSQYFDHLKDAKQTISNEDIKESFDTFMKLAEKYKTLGQKESIKKLCFLAETLKKEEKIIDMGITTYVYNDIITEYINDIAGDSVKIVELSRYMREIPDELVDTITKVREIFDEIYVVFTDYTGREERKIAKERRDKDPILFGAFFDRKKNVVCDRFYFIGDWVDEYCDLTLDKMVMEYKSVKGVSPAMDIVIPKTTDELIDVMKGYVEKEPDSKEGNQYLVGEGLPLDAYINTGKPEKKGNFFEKVRSFITRKKK